MEEELVIKYIIACTNLYGIVPIEKVVEIYNDQNKEVITFDAVKRLVQSGQIKEQLEERFVYIESDKFVAEAASEDDEKEILEHMADGKPYYVPGKAELLLFMEEEYIQETPEQQKLKSMLKEDFGEGLDIEGEVTGLVFNLQVSGGDFMEVLSLFIEGIELPIEKAEQYIPVIVDIANTTRLWENRGHTANELLSQ